MRFPRCQRGRAVVAPCLLKTPHSESGGVVPIFSGQGGWMGFYGRTAVFPELLKQSSACASRL